ncbi:S8 family peptidase [Bacteroidales bacterium OttesenSCG-928-I14]|nr:S8 family peptidase [Bacteroidales bacterium OttesenSCG-928-I14]
MKNIILLSCLTLLFSLSAAFANEDGTWQEGALYIKLKTVANQTKSDRRECSVKELLHTSSSSIIQKYAIKESAESMRLFDSKYLNNVYRIEFDSIQLTDQLIEDLKSDSRIELVERVPVHTIPIVTQEDPIGTYLVRNDTKNLNIIDDTFWGIVDGVHTSWFWDIIGFDEVYGRYSGNPDVKVAIVDNAVWEGHEDLSFEYDNLYDTFLGVEGSASPPRQASLDPYGWSHGTHCAGLIGAMTNNGTGIASLASGVSLLGVKTAESSGVDLVRTVQGVIWAAENGAKIISMSYGSGTESQIEKEILESCVKNGIILIAAAGNNGQDQEYYPAQFEGVISVASVNSDMKKSNFSNYGSWVDIAAPGGYYVTPEGELDENSQILSTTYCKNQTFTNKPSFLGKNYDMMVGTSMATPIVSSLAALIVSYYPDLNSYQLLEVLQKSSIKVNPSVLYINENSGVINAPAAMELMENSQDKYVKNLKATLNIDKNEVLMEWLQPTEKTGIAGYRIYENDKILEELTQQLSYKLPYNKDMDNNFYGVKAIYDNDEGLTDYAKINTAPSGIEDNITLETNLKYYVNNAGQLILLSNKEIDRVFVFDIQGRKLIESSYKAGGIDLSLLSRGVYLINVKYDNGEETIKISL